MTDIAMCRDEACEKIEPCYNCGCKDVSIHYDDDDGYYVWCRKCHHATLSYDTAGKAVGVWNSKYKNWRADSDTR